MGMAMEERDLKVKKIFDGNGLRFGWGWDSDGNLEVEVLDGDWRHDHVALDIAMKKNGYEKVKELHSGVYTGGDWYTSVHVFKIPEAKC